MERTYISIDGEQHIVEGSADQVLRRWERAKLAGTFLRFNLPDSQRAHYVHPDAVRSIGEPAGTGGTLTWAD
ncbi:MAG: hypothetical protein JHD16_07220 [Solirubrobacteraceae bacterium]|nr:hypothetical protein [Solirubrobacteraceae bacterium]